MTRPHELVSAHQLLVGLVATGPLSRSVERQQFGLLEPAAFHAGQRVVRQRLPVTEPVERHAADFQQLDRLAYREHFIVSRHAAECITALLPVSECITPGVTFGVPDDTLRYVQIHPGTRRTPGAHLALPAHGLPQHSRRNLAIGDTHMAQTATRNEPADISIPVNNNLGGDFTIVPAGIYQIEFTGFDDGPSFPNRNDPTQLDETIRLKYQILEGEYAGETIDELASLKGGVKSKLRQRAEALRNEPYAADDSIRLVPLYGKRAQAVVRVEENEKGPRNKIDSLVPPPAPRAAGTVARPVASRAAAQPTGRNF